MTRPPHVVVIGAGFAGFAAAVALAAREARVTVLEARRTAGGRAGSFPDPETGETVDNGQHLFMACYRDTRLFLKRLGSLPLLKFQRRLGITWLEPGRRVRLSCPPLPAPFHLLAGTFMMKGLTMADRKALLAAAGPLRRLAHSNGHDLSRITVTRWLDDMGQTERLRRYLWHPLAIAALNASPDRAPASLLAHVLDEAFLHGQGDSALGYATVGLSALYVEQSRRCIESRGGVLRCGALVSGLVTHGASVRGVTLRDGETVEADAVVCAAPPDDAARLGVPVDGLARFESSPILSVNLWYDRPLASFADFDFAGVIGRDVQWLFNKQRILEGRATHLAAVISAADDHVKRSNDDLARMAADDVRACLPAARGARVTRSVVVRERTATMSPTVETESLRPGQATPLANLHLAGDWTMRGMPATIEAAVRSGHLCADRIMPPG